MSRPQRKVDFTMLAFTALFNEVEESVAILSCGDQNGINARDIIKEIRGRVHEKGLGWRHFESVKIGEPQCREESILIKCISEAQVRELIESVKAVHGDIEIEYACREKGSNNYMVSHIPNPETSPDCGEGYDIYEVFMPRASYFQTGYTREKLEIDFE
ncbi:MAG: hypothetical protein HUJ78_07005 [Mogibacterium sp.]|nr:hypothetical protein [Mogibacterium sp.]